MILLPIHIIAGLIAIAAGFVALYTVKGMKRHRKSGTVFVYAMLVLAGTGATIAAIKSQPANVMGGLMSIYLVTTGVLTLRARDGAMRVIDAASLAAAIALAFLSTRLVFEIARSPTGTMNGVTFHYWAVDSCRALVARHGLELVSVYDDPGVSTYFCTRKTR